MINYLKKVEGVSTPLATKFEPLFRVGERKRSYAGENPDVYVDGVWYNSTNGDELAPQGAINWIEFAGGHTASDEGTRVKITSGSGTDNGMYINVPTTIGKEYTFNIKASKGSVNQAVWFTDSNDATIGEYQSIADSHDYTLTFVANDTQYRIRSAGNFTGAGQTCYVDSVTSFETEIKPDTPYVTPQTYLPIRADINAEGEITNLIAWDAPSLVENYIVADKLKVVQGFDLDQEWIDVTNDRTLGVEEKNDSGKPRHIRITSTIAGGNWDIKINDVTIKFMYNSSTGATGYITVFPNDTYILTGNSSGILWYEA